MIELKTPWGTRGDVCPLKIVAYEGGTRSTLDTALEEIDGFDVAYVADDVDGSLRHEIGDQEDILGRVVYPQRATFCDILDLAANESLQAIDVAIVGRDQDRTVRSFVNGQAAADFSVGIVDVSNVGALTRADE